MDPNWIMAIIALAAIFSPAIVSIIDNIFKYKSKQLELSYPNKRKALSDFVSASLNVYVDATYGDMVNYNIAKNNLYVYFDHINDKHFKDLEAYKSKKDLDNYKNVINTVDKELSSQINKWKLL